jgi:hypothetical protein
MNKKETVTRFLFSACATSYVGLAGWLSIGSTLLWIEIMSFSLVKNLRGKQASLQRTN